MIKTSAPAKIILFGEHAVVYGEQAIATAIDRRLYVTACELDEPKVVVESKTVEKSFEASLNSKSNEPLVKVVHAALKQVGQSANKGIGVDIDSDIPVSAGLGSSAALASATATAVMGLYQETLDPFDIAKAAYEAEKIYHGTPSGIDNSITTLGGTISFKKGKIDPLEVSEEFQLVVGNTKIKGNTKELVEKVRTYVEDPRVSYNIFSIGSLSWRAKEALLKNNLIELGSLMNKNHEYLRKLGVSCPEIEKLINIARESGAYGAKLTGGGGGGCILALSDDPREVVNALKKEGADAFIVNINQEGVRIEN